MEKVSKGMKIALLLTVIIGGYVALFYVHFEVALIISILIGSLLGMVMMAVEMVPPRKVMVVRNKLTGELSARIGLTFVFPFIEEIVKVLDCRPVVEEPISIKALTKEGEEVALGIQRTYWIDALEPEAPKDKFKGEKGRKGKRRAILAATKIPGEEEEVMERIKEVVDNFTKAHLERLVSKVTMDDLEKDVIPAGFALICPRCGRVLRAKKKGSFPSYCGEEKEERKKEKKKKKECDAKWSVKKKELSFPQTLLGLISFGTSIWVDHDLGEEFGVGCEIRVLNLKPPAEMIEMKLSKEVAEAEREVKKTKLEVKELEGKMIDAFSKKTKISPNLIYITENIVRMLEKLFSFLEKKKKGGREE